MTVGDIDTGKPGTLAPVGRLKVMLVRGDGYEGSLAANPAPETCSKAPGGAAAALIACTAGGFELRTMKLTRFDVADPAEIIRRTTPAPLSVAGNSILT